MGLERWEIQESTSSGVRRDDEDVVFSIWEVGCFSIIAIVEGTLSVRRRRWGGRVHCVTGLKAV